MLVPRIGSFQAKKIQVICKQIRNQELRSPGRNFRKADLKTATHSKKRTKYLLILIFLFGFYFEMEKIYGGMRCGENRRNGIINAEGHDC